MPSIETGIKVEPGIYRHFRGKLYWVLGTSVDTESGDVSVVYRDRDGKLWHRPILNFVAVIDGKPRFELLKKINRGSLSYEEWEGIATPK